MKLEQLNLDPKLLHFVNQLAPEHCRTSCSDNNLYNGIEYDSDSKTLAKSRCQRCSLIKIAADPEYKNTEDNLLFEL